MSVNFSDIKPVIKEAVRDVVREEVEEVLKENMKTVVREAIFSKGALSQLIAESVKGVVSAESTPQSRSKNIQEGKQRREKKTPKNGSGDASTERMQKHFKKLMKARNKNNAGSGQMVNESAQQQTSQQPEFNLDAIGADSGGANNSSPIPQGDGGGIPDRPSQDIAQLEQQAEQMRKEMQANAGGQAAAGMGGGMQNPQMQQQQQMMRQQAMQQQGAQQQQTPENVKPPTDQPLKGQMKMKRDIKQKINNNVEMPDEVSKKAKQVAKGNS